MLKNKRFAILACIIFIIEVLIATVFNHTFLRPVFGDFLVVILMYAAIRGVTNWKKINIAVLVLMIAYFVEFLQWIDVLSRLGIKKNMMTHIVLGSSFDWNDMLAYTIGVGFVFVLDKIPVKLTHL